jgi:hypothetical protein
MSRIHCLQIDNPNGACVPRAVAATLPALERSGLDNAAMQAVPCVSKAVLL